MAAAMRILLLATAVLPVALADFQIGSRAQILESAKTLAYDLMLFYHGNETGQEPGILPGPPTENKGDYFWWEGGAMMGTYIDYWHLTGDSTYNDIVTEGILHQVGEGRDFMPAKYTITLGNDDQGFWGMSAMLAAETKFPDPDPDQPQWLALAQAVFNTQASPERHDNTCGGGMRWQIPQTNEGYDYKNTIANGCFFNLGARLARYTNNETYAEWAADTFDWLWNVQFINNTDWAVYDGALVDKNCTKIRKHQFSYNSAILLEGCAFMYNFTNGAAIWKDRIDNLLDSTLSTFFPDNVAYEVACEPNKGSCTADMLTYKGFAHRWLAGVTRLAGFTSAKILPVLRDSAAAAVGQCTGGASGRACGFYWGEGRFWDPLATDGTTGAGEQMNVLAAVSSLLVEEAEPPVTAAKGGTSEGDPDAGGGRRQVDIYTSPVTTADRAGAGILTFLIAAAALGMFWFMVW